MLVFMILFDAVCPGLNMTTVYATDVESENLDIITNGDFEKDDVMVNPVVGVGNWSKSDIGESGWKCAPKSVGSTYQILLEGVDSNNKVLKILHDSSVSNNAERVDGVIKQSYVARYSNGLEDGEKYTVSARIKAVNSGATSDIVFKINNKSATNALNASNCSDWNNFSFEYTHSGVDSKKELEIQMRNVAAGGYWLLDDISIEKVQSEDITENDDTALIFNGNFEQGLGGKLTEQTSGTVAIGTNSGWKSWVSTNTTGAMANFEIVAGEGRGETGSQAMKLWRTTTSDTISTAGPLVVSLLSNDMGNLIEGKTYLLTAHVKPVDVNSDAYLYLVWRDQDKAEYTAHTIKAADMAAGEWNELQYQFKAGEDKKLARVELKVRAYKEGSWLFDDITLERIPDEPYIEIEKNISVELGKTVTISAEIVDPDKVLGDEPVTLTWISDDVSVATVDQTGVVTPVSEGIANIIVSMAGGKYVAQCQVNVTEPVVPLVGISMDSSLTMQAGSEKKINVTFNPVNTTDKALTWTSTDETVAQVDADGTITAIAAGNATIKAASTNNSAITAECTVTVTSSTKLLVEQAAFETAFGASYEGTLNGFVTKNDTGNNVKYELYEAPTRGYMVVEEDGSFIYASGIVPNGVPEIGVGLGEGGDYAFKVRVIAGEESALLTGTIEVKDLSETLDGLQSGTKVFFSEEAIAGAKEEIKIEGSLKNRLYQEFISAVEPLLNSEPPNYTDYSDEDNNEGGWQRSEAEKVTNLLAAYLLTDKQAYKEKCIEYAVALAGYPHWGVGANYKDGSITAGFNGFSVALAYNWLKDEMTVEQKQILLNRLHYTGQRIYERETSRIDYLTNHTWITNAALLSLSLSLYYDAEAAVELLKIDDDLSDIDINYTKSITAEELKADCAKWIEWVCHDLGQTFYWLPEDGVFHESPSYYLFGVTCLVKASLILENNLGIDTFTGNSFYENSSEWFLNVMLPEDGLSSVNYLMDYGDGKRRSQAGAVEIFGVLASKYQDETASHIVELTMEAGAGTPGCYWMPILCAEEEIEPGYEENAATFFYGDSVGMVISRSDWSGKESVLLAKCGIPTGKQARALLPLGKSEFHDDPDANSLILYSNGEFLLKSDGYGGKYTGNLSTLLIDGNGQIGSTHGSSGVVLDDYAILGLEPTMTVVESTDAYDYFVGNATEAYNPALSLNKFERNYVYLKQENVLLIVDDIKTVKNQPLQLRWFPESKTVSENYGIYSVYSGYNIMNFYPFTTQNVTTEYMDAEVWRTNKKEAEGAFVQDYTGSMWQNAVAFSWAPTGEKQTQVKYQTGENANEHIYEVNGKLYIINVSRNTLTVEEGTLNQSNAWASDSTLASISFNNFVFEDFDSAVTEYTLERFWKTTDLEILPIASAPNGAEVTMDWNGECPGTVTITCVSEDKSSTTVYHINLKNDKGMLSIQSASAVPDTLGHDINLSFDGFVSPNDSLKTWASKECPVVTYDMGRVVNISKIEVAFNVSRDRGNYYDLLVSEDGTSWRTLKSGAKSEQTAADGALNEYQTIYSNDSDEELRAQYVQIKLRGNDTNNGMIDDVTDYCSIQEISIYGTEVSDF